MRSRDLNMNSKYIVWRMKKVLENKEKLCIREKTLVAKDENDKFKN